MNIDHPLAEWLRRKWGPVTCDLDGVGSIPAIPKAQYVPSLLCHERFNEASLPDKHIDKSDFELLELDTDGNCFAFSFDSFDKLTTYKNTFRRSI